MHIATLYGGQLWRFLLKLERSADLLKLRSYMRHVHACVWRSTDIITHTNGGPTTIPEKAPTVGITDTSSLFTSKLQQAVANTV